MKNTKIISNYVFIIMTISLVISSCKENKEMKNQSTIVIEKNNNFDTIAPTKYNDGRLSEVRIFNYYYASRDTAVEKKGDSIKLKYVVLEWNKYEAIVADGEGAFVQLETNTMRGGDVGTNKRVQKSSSLFFKQTEKLFEEKINTLLKVNEIPNRNVDAVSFDFITNKGVYTIQESKKTLESGSTDLSKIFKDAKSLKLEVENAGNRQKN